MNLQRPVLLAGHLEFGDAVVCNGLVRTLAKKIPRLVVPTRPWYVETVHNMLGDLRNVSIVSTQDYEAAQAQVDGWGEDNVIGLGFFHKGRFEQLNWDREFYRQAGVPFEFRWSAFQLADCLPDPVPTEVLVHEDPFRGYLIKDLPEATRITSRPSILDWLPEVLGARELHCIDSSFLNLAESLYYVGQLRHTRLVFHRYAKKYPGPARWPELRAPWEVIG